MPSATPTYVPMLAATSPTVPAGDEWRFEVKWDGFRAIARVEDDDVRLWSRNGKSLERTSGDIARALPLALTSTDCVLDGELCAFDENGVPSFALFQQGKGALAYVIFDLLELDGEPVTREPWTRRRELLEDLVLPGAASIVLSQVYEDGEALLDAARRRGLEGVMAKRAGSLYKPGRRSDDWRKIKLRQSAALRIAGYTSGQGARARLGALILATDDLEYAGNCGSGLSDADMRELLEAFAPLRRETSPLRGPGPTGAARARVTWLEPALACEVEFAEWTRDHRLRAPVFKRLAKEQGVTKKAKQPARELKLTNLGKVFFPDEQITKGDLLGYYRQAAPFIVPYLRDRPITLVRYPDGITGKHFFQKQHPPHAPAWMRTATLPSSSDGSGKTIDYLVIDDEDGLLWTINAGCIDVHAPYARAQSFTSPDFALFDLDPSPGVTLAQTGRVALLVRDALAVLELEAVVKTSSAEGMHLAVPLRPGHTYPQARALVQLVAQALERAHPDLVTTEWNKSRRHGVLIDSNQVGYGRTMSVAYCVRPRPGAPVSLPLTWDEVESGAFARARPTMRAALRRMDKLGDPFAGALAVNQRLPAALLG
ncbi:MAG: bifunctional non-ous end joining protein LigD [Gaiellales bacterium]|nr:bifunctional non-ous end joining protein LigD [Gaiellales bacterium]